MNKVNKKTIIIIIVAIILIFIAFWYNFENNNSITYNEELIPYEEAQEGEGNAEEKNSEDNDVTEEKVEAKIVVYITGEVKNGGVFSLQENSRISDLIELAGGLSEEADISEINLAYKLEDGMKIEIPNINDKKIDDSNENKIAEQTDSYITFANKNSSSKSSKNNSKVNLNTATQAELETLPGIGPSTALKIINYRKENGKFSSIEEIKEVSGIGEAKFLNIKDLITV